MMDAEIIRIDSDISVSSSEGLTAPEFTCHCCYEILIDPTTLTCGHNFCRHCLAMWWSSSGQAQCPECREIWEGFPKINILLRDAVEKLFPDDVNRRRRGVQGDPQACQVLLAFHQFGEKRAHGAGASKHSLQQKGFYTGVIAALSCMSLLLLLYMMWPRVDQDAVSKPVSRWSVDDVTLWMDELGDWSRQYRETFRREQISGRLLTVLGDEDLSEAPFRIEDPLHRRALLQEIQNIKHLGVKAPGNLWEYKAMNLGKSLFLLIGLRDSPRVTLLYLYLFDYDQTFLPFIHTSWPAQRANTTQDDPSHQTQHDQPTWRQWAGFLVMYCLLPYHLLIEFAWNWLNVHYWTSRIVILNASLLSVLEITFIWRLWSRGEIMTLPNRMWHHLKKTMSQWLIFVLLWPIIPQFICNWEFYIGLYFSPIFNIVVLSKNF